MKPLDEELQEIRKGFLTLWVDKAYHQYLKVGEQMDFAIVADMIQYYYESKIRQLVEDRERGKDYSGLDCTCSQHSGNVSFYNSTLGGNPGTTAGRILKLCDNGAMKKLGGLRSVLKIKNQ